MGQLAVCESVFVYPRACLHLAPLLLTRTFEHEPLLLHTGKTRHVLHSCTF